MKTTYTLFKRSLFFLVGVLLGSCNKEESGPIQVSLKAEAHNSLGEFYTDFPAKLTCQGCQFSVSTYILDGGDGDVDTINGPFNANGLNLYHTYQSPGSYSVSVRMISGAQTYRFDSVVQVRTHPRLIGDAESGEAAKLLVHNIAGGFKLIYSGYDIHTGSPTVFRVNVSDNLDLQTPVKLLNYDPQETRYVKSADGKVLISGTPESLVFAQNLVDDLHQIGTLQLFYRDGEFSGGNLRILQDSITVSNTIYNVVKTINLTTWSVSTTKVFSDMYSGAFGGESALVVFRYTGFKMIDLNVNTRYQQTVVGNIYVDEVEVLPSGTLMLISDQLIMLNQDGGLRWKLPLPNYQNDYIRNGKRVLMNEVAGNVFVFFGSMRYLKISPQGTVLKEGYYYPGQCQVEDVEMDTQGNFVFAATRYFERIPNQPMSTRYDVVLIKITPDGEILD